MPFSAKTLDFLFENRLHDSRIWFEEHKEEYQKQVLFPLQELVRQLTPHVLKIDSQLTTEPRVDRTICRIRRDTRFSHDKSLYRDNMWIIFKRGKMHGTEVPGIYFEIAADGFHYGCGFYNASVRYMETMRSMILANDPDFCKADQRFCSQAVYHIEGDCYKRPRFEKQPQNRREGLERRGICFVADSQDFELLFSNHLAEKLAADFSILSPIYRFLQKVSFVEREKRENKLEVQRP